jgi:single-stranded DNA-specific DHH superfamily exonuclease
MKQLEKLKPSVLIIPDAGSNDIEQMKYLSDKGWLILCFDHHKIEA